MAVTVSSLALNLRIITEPGQTLEEPYSTILSLLLAWAEETVDLQAPGAPNSTRDLAINQLCGYIYDKPQSAQGQAYANAWINSGASNILRNYIKRRAIGLGGTSDATPGDGGTTATINEEQLLRLIREQLRPAFAAERENLDAELRKFIDQEVDNRNAAIDAKIAAHRSIPTAHQTITGGGGSAAGGTQITWHHMMYDAARRENLSLRNNYLVPTGFMYNDDDIEVSIYISEAEDSGKWQMLPIPIAILDALPDLTVDSTLKRTTTGLTNANRIQIEAIGVDGNIDMYVGKDANNQILLGCRTNTEYTDIRNLYFKQITASVTDDGTTDPTDLTPAESQLTVGLSNHRFVWDASATQDLARRANNWLEVPNLLFDDSAQFIDVFLLGRNIYHATDEEHHTGVTDSYRIDVKRLLGFSSRTKDTRYVPPGRTLANPIDYVIDVTVNFEDATSVIRHERIAFSWYNSGTVDNPEYRLLVANSPQTGHPVSSSSIYDLITGFIFHVVFGGTTGGVLPVGSDAHNKLEWTGTSWQAVSDEKTVYYALTRDGAVANAANAIRYFLNNVSGYTLADNTRPYAVNRGFGSNLFRLEDLWLWPNGAAAPFAWILVPARYKVWLESFKVLLKADPDRFTILPTEAGSDAVLTPVLQSTELRINGVLYSLGLIQLTGNRPTTKYQVTMQYTAPAVAESTVEVVQ